MELACGMVTVASLNHPAPPEKDIVTEFKVPISFGVNVISAVSAFPLTFRLDGTLLFALSLAALTAFGVAASDSLVLSTALLSFTTPLVVRLASSIATAPANSSARSAAASARVAADSAAVLL